MTDSCFQIKGSVVTVVVLELHHYDAAAFAEQLEHKIQQAPQLLANSPVVINPEKCTDAPGDVDFEQMLRQCRDLGLQPIGFRWCEPFNEAMGATGLALLPHTAGRRGPAIRDTSRDAARDESTSPAADASEETTGPPARLPAKIITRPVRSGQQIYAKDSDLIVMAQVSEGAELLADGNIHVYSGLRGRALAGVKGDETARIFCQSMEAELLSVAGHFVLSDDFRDELWRKPVQVYLEEGDLSLEPL
jgi:septum site-determining protein MinC